MQSYLTPTVIRRILTNRPIPHQRCRIHAHARATVPVLDSRRANAIQLRTFTSLFSWGKTKDRTPRQANFAPGLETLVALTRALRLGIRPEPDAVLLKAFDAYWNSKRRPSDQTSKSDSAPPPCRDFELQHVISAFKYLRQSPDGFKALKYRPSQFKRIIEALERRDKGDSTIHVELTELVYAWWLECSKDTAIEAADQRHDISLTVATIRTLNSQGATNKARELLEQSLSKLPRKSVEDIFHRMFLQGRHRNILEIESLIEFTRTHNITLSATLKYDIASSFAASGDIATALKWHETAKADKAMKPDPRIAGVIIQNAVKHGQAGAVETLVRESLSRDSTKSKTLGQIVVWAAAIGKGVEDLNKMLDSVDQRIMEERERKHNRPADILDGIDVVNDLLKFAISRKDAYLAERYVSLAYTRGYQPDGMTFLLQMQYRLLAGDVHGARDIYNQVQAEDFEDNTNYIGVLNQYIQALVNTSKDGAALEEVLQVCEELGKHGAVFKPATVSALCILHLHHGDLHDVIDLLQLNCPRYTNEDRASVQETFQKFCLDKQNSTADVWDAYMIFREIFDETTREQRTQIMNDLFERDRPDLATHVFNHMLFHSLPSVYATRDTYIEVLIGIGKSAHKPSLEHVQNRLRVDARVDPDTKLYNALMMAYIRCGLPNAALDRWEDIATSREGPTKRSIIIALMACRSSNFGESKGREIWATLQRNGIEITSSMLANYAGCIGRRGYIDEALAEISTAQSRFGFAPTAEVLGTVLNASRDSQRHSDVQIWIQENYPKIWKEEMLSNMHTTERLRFEDGSVVDNLWYQVPNFALP